MVGLGHILMSVALDTFAFIVPFLHTEILKPYFWVCYYKDEYRNIRYSNTFLHIKVFFPADFILLFILFIFRERGREGEREGEKHPCVRDTPISCLSHAPNWGPGLSPRHVPWLGIKPATSLSLSYHSTHWATPVSYTHLTLPTNVSMCRSRWSPYH